MTRLQGGIALRLSDITVSRGGEPVLKGFGLAAAAGGAVGITGANGTGKTTVLDVISGLVRPDSGEVRFDGRPVTSASPQDRRRVGVSRVFQESRLYPQMTAAEVALVSARHGTDAPRVDVISAPETTFVYELSTGQRRLLDLTAATSRGARLLLLDEPMAGIAPHERRRVIELVKAWRARTNGTLIVVEHDRVWLDELVDEVISLDGAGPPAVHRDGETPNGEALTSAKNVAELADFVASTRRPDSLLRPSAPSAWALARFGLREFAAGMLSVLTLGVLNRVMKVDLGIPLVVVAPILAAYNLAAPFALWIGARSDRRAIRGLHRTPYIVAGALLMGTMAAVAPFVAWRLQTSVGIVSIAFGVVVFAAMGIGMYGSGATYFALLSEVVSIGRERAIAVVYSMLMAGILAGVGLSAYVLPNYDAGSLLSLHALVGVIVIACTWWAVHGVEGRNAPIASEPRVGLRAFASSGQVRRFFFFMMGLTFFAFLQQAILEPYGGDVFDLSVGATTSFNAIQIFGVLLGMAVAARVAVARFGRRGTTAIGSVIGAVGLCSLGVSASDESRFLLYSGIFLLGLGLGLLNVGSLTLMLDMTAGHVAGLAMGLWTVAHALADGAATASGGVLHSLIEHMLGSDAAAYSSVFFVEAIGLVAVLLLLRGVDPNDFRQEFRTVVVAPRGG